ncbi:hypothetical protein BKA62DRAFT_705544 [Auriculariales sp. MPI-PUGE-AT-0066]|nr:hypothetical protein BKA62DRAFT_705544 [Auriculariales sp. MPI-PUGE-AT-0066]
MSQAPYSLPLSAGSGTWIYKPQRNALVARGWNASYTQSTVWPTGQGGTVNGQGSLYFRTQMANATINTAFTGTGITLCISDNNAPFTVSLESKQVTVGSTANDAACQTLGAAKTISIGNLDFGSYNIALSVTASNDNEFRFFGGVVQTMIAVDAASQQATEYVVDDQDAGWELERGGEYGWAIAQNSQAFRGSFSFVCPYGDLATAIYRFKGASAVVLYGQPYTDTRDYSILLNDKLFNSAATSSGWLLSPQTPLYFQAGLDPSTEYTLTYRDYSDDNPDCPDAAPDLYCCATLDSLKLLGSASGLAHFLPSNISSSSQTSVIVSGSASPTVSQPFGESTVTESQATSTNVGAIAGGVVGSFVAVLIIAFGVFLLWRRRQKQTASWNNASVSASRTNYPPPASNASATVGSSSISASRDPTIRPFALGQPATLMSGPPVRREKSGAFVAPESSVRDRTISAGGSVSGVGATAGSTTSRSTRWSLRSSPLTKQVPPPVHNRPPISDIGSTWAGGESLPPAYRQ